MGMHIDKSWCHELSSCIQHLYSCRCKIRLICFVFFVFRNLPEGVLNLVKPHVENHEYTLQAALTCDRELVYKAFLNDPLVKGHNPSVEDVKKLADDMIENTMKYLPEGWRK